MVVIDIKWDPGWLYATRTLHLRRTFSAKDYHQAAKAVKAERKTSASRKSLFVIYFAGEGWIVGELTEAVWFNKIQLDELELHDVPLGGSLEDPQTYLVDADDNLGKVVKRNGNYVIEQLAVEPQPKEPRPFVPFVTTYRMQNHSGNIRWEPKVGIRPGFDADELSRSLSWASQNTEGPIKASGSRHSWSAAAASSSVFIHPEGTRSKVHVESGSPNFYVSAGSKIRDINTALWEAGFAMPFLGGWDGQTLAGVLPTGTHGSMLRYGPIASVVRRIDLVKFNGSKVRIGPSQGSGSSVAGWGVVNDDDTFNAALINMGTMGIVHGYLIKPTTRFWLREVRTATTIADVVKTCSGGNIYHLMKVDTIPSWAEPEDDRQFKGHNKPSYHEEFLWNPYTNKVIVTSRDDVDEKFQETYRKEEPDHFSVPQPLKLSKLCSIDKKYRRPIATNLAAKYLGDITASIMEGLSKHLPKAIPSLIDRAMEGLVDDEYVHRSYNVFNIGEAQNMVPAMSSTIAVPLQDDMWLEALDIVSHTLRNLKNKKKIVQTGPIALRFVRGSRILLASQQDICQFEFLASGTSDDIHDKALEITRQCYLNLYARFPGKVLLHWGQLIPTGTIEEQVSGGISRLEQSYASYSKWRSVRNSFDPDRRGLNSWQKAIFPL